MQISCHPLCIKWNDGFTEDWIFDKAQAYIQSNCLFKTSNIKLKCHWFAMHVEEVDASLFMMPKITSIKRRVREEWFPLRKQNRWDLNIQLFIFFRPDLPQYRWESSKLLFAIFFPFFLHNSCAKSEIWKNCFMSRWAVKSALLKASMMICFECSQLPLESSLFVCVYLCCCSGIHKSS